MKKNTEPLISIIIPVYNTEEFLSKCLDSCVNQTYKNVEIIVVNDGSSGNCKEICDQYKAVYLDYKENKGTYFAREFGTKNAQGDYILYLDPDDWLDPKLCEKLVKKLTPTCDFVLFDVLSIRSNTVEKTIWTNKGNQNYQGQELFNALLDRSYSSWAMWGKLFRRDIALKVYDELAVTDKLVLAEDLLVVVLYSFYCKETIYVPVNGYYYNLNETSINGSQYTLAKVRLHIDNFKVISQKMKEFLIRHNLSDDSFHYVKLELVQGFCVNSADVIESDFELQQELFTLFGKELYVLATYQCQLKSNPFRSFSDKVMQKIFNKNSIIYQMLRKFLLRINHFK